MKKLSKEQIAGRDALADVLEREYKDLDEAYDTLVEAAEEYNKIVAAYNKHLEGAREFVDDVVSEIDTYFEGKSEAWQDSDAGQAYADWKSAWEEIDLTDVDEATLEFSRDNLPSGLHTELLELPDSPG